MLPSISRLASSSGPREFWGLGVKLLGGTCWWYFEGCAGVLHSEYRDENEEDGS